MKIDGYNVKLIRGDSDSLTVSCTKEGLPFALVEGDIVYLTVKQNVSVKEYLIQKVITVFENGKAVIPFYPRDTKGLGFQTYVYDVQVNFPDETVKTIVPVSNFTILREVTCE